MATPSTTTSASEPPAHSQRPLTSTISNPPNVAPPQPTYSHICTVPLSTTATLVTLAGQIGVDPEPPHKPAPTYAEQIRLAFSNVDRCLAHVGATKSDIVQVRQYVVGLHPVDPVRSQLYMEWMDEVGRKPPSTLVGVESLATRELLFEIEVVAVVHRDA